MGGQGQRAKGKVVCGKGVVWRIGGVGILYNLGRAKLGERGVGRRAGNWLHVRIVNRLHPQ